MNSLDNIKDNFSEQDIIDANIVVTILLKSGTKREGYFRGTITHNDLLPNSPIKQNRKYVTILDLNGTPKNTLLHIPQDEIKDITYSL